MTTITKQEQLPLLLFIIQLLLPVLVASFSLIQSVFSFPLLVLWVSYIFGTLARDGSVRCYLETTSDPLLASPHLVHQYLRQVIQEHLPSLRYLPAPSLAEHFDSRFPQSWTKALNSEFFSLSWFSIWAMTIFPFLNRFSLWRFWNRFPFICSFFHDRQSAFLFSQSLRITRL